MMGLNDLRASKPKHETAFGAPWSDTITCPGCGGEVDEVKNPRAGQPSRACADPRCRFKHGWRLRPMAEVTHNLRDGTPVNKIVAVPLLVNGSEDLPGQVPWPRIVIPDNKKEDQVDERAR